jgi:histidinol-phosphate/aromatic aminotransferase/cobyric acid decarboxylase-like protein
MGISGEASFVGWIALFSREALPLDILLTRLELTNRLARQFRTNSINRAGCARAKQCFETEGFGARFSHLLVEVQSSGMIVTPQDDVLPENREHQVRPDACRKARISEATLSDRPAIYRMRHDVYAQELGQHKTTSGEVLSDSLDSFNHYITAYIADELVGFISITPPGFGKYSIDKYIARDAVAVPFEDALYEFRILTVAKQHRSSRLAGTLIYAAFRWTEERLGKNIIAMGRTDILSIYIKFGMQPLNLQIKSGAVTYELLKSTTERQRAVVERHHRFLKNVCREVIWDLDMPFFKPAGCFHGGAFFDAVGTGFDSLERRASIISADVLDAWFPPSPKVIETLKEHLPWLIGTSPPTASEGLRQAIARYRGVDVENILPGAGSSDLIYLAYRQWLNKQSRVLILDPSYGEYVHILENVIHCRVHRLFLERRDNYVVDLEQLRAQAQMGYDLIVLINPNNPTGQHIPCKQLIQVLAGVPSSTRVWVDEAYLDYVAADESLEKFASRSENVIVCKSMSKVYALSGMRVAYLCAAMHQLAELIPITPPWAVSLPAQVAAVRALEDGAYYMGRYQETPGLRAQVIEGLRGMGVREIVPSTTNFVMFHLEPQHPCVQAVIDSARKSGVFLRDVSSMSERRPCALRIAVKDEETNATMLEVLARVLAPTCASTISSPL